MNGLSFIKFQSRSLCGVYIPVCMYTLLMYGYIPKTASKCIVETCILDVTSNSISGASLLQFENDSGLHSCHACKLVTVAQQLCIANISIIITNQTIDTCLSKIEHPHLVHV